MSTEKPIQEILCYADQRPDDLVLAVITEPLTIPVKVLAQAQHVAGPFKFTLSIIGESHIVRVEREGRLLMQEMLACVPLESQPCVYTCDFPALDGCRYARPHYSVSVDFDLPEDQQYRPPQVLGTLRYAFPTTHDQVPETVIGWGTKRDAHALHWWTLHHYPREEGKRTVFTASRFDFLGYEQYGLNWSIDLMKSY